MKRGTPEHPKLLMLASNLGVPKYAAVGLLESLWHFTARYAPLGDVGKYPAQLIAQSIGWEGKPETLTNGLVETGWLDRQDQNGLLIHDWSTHADDSVHMANARRGHYFADGTKPRMSRLTKVERRAAEKIYSENAQKTHSVATGNALPSPTQPSPTMPSQAIAPPTPSVRDVGECGAMNGKPKPVASGSGSDSLRVGGGDRVEAGEGPLARTLGRTMQGLSQSNNGNSVMPSLHAVFCEIGIENRETLRALASRKDLSVPLVRFHHIRLKRDRSITNPVGALVKFLNSKRFSESDRCKAAEAVT